MGADPIRYLGQPFDEPGCQGRQRAITIRAEQIGGAEHTLNDLFMPYRYGYGKPWARRALAAVGAPLWFFDATDPVPVPAPKPRRKRRPPNRMHSQPALPPAPYAPATHSWKLEVRLKCEALKPKPSPGWQPMTGADIEALIQQYQQFPETHHPSTGKEDR